MSVVPLARSECSCAKHKRLTKVVEQIFHAAKRSEPEICEAKRARTLRSEASPSLRSKPKSASPHQANTKQTHTYPQNKKRKGVK